MKARGCAALSDEARKLLGDHEACKKQLASFCASDNETGSALPVAWHDQGPGIGLRESARLSQIPYQS